MPLVGVLLLAGAVALQALQPLRGQMPFHDRGPGELLSPQLRAATPLPDMVDLTRPEYLWAFHRDALLPPAAWPALPKDVLAQVVTALARTAATTSADAGLRWQSLWALARCARHEVTAAKELRGLAQDLRLLQADGPLGEVAAVAIGLALHDEPKLLDALVSLATDAKANERRRAFACYGLGLAAQESSAATVQFRVLAAVEHVLLAGNAAPAEVRIAALHALALTRIDIAPALPAPALRLLEQSWNEAPPPAATPLDFRAHVPIAVATLVTPGAPDAEAWRERMAAGARATGGSLSVPRSCVLALGALCRPWREASDADARHGELLRELATQARDLQLRYYATFAMGLAGGEQHRAFLRERLGGRAIERPWAAIALAAAASREPTVDEEAVTAIARVQAATKDPSYQAVYEQALTVARRAAVTDPAVSFLERYRQPLPAAGDAANPVTELIRGLLDPATSLEQKCLSAVALGHLADASPRHWSTRLARSIDYRNATPALLGLPHGVLRLP